MSCNIRKHAAIRIEARTSLSPSEVQTMLDSGRYYPIGSDSRKEHIHKVVYSHRDDQLFVVVEDLSNKDVITLFPLDYHNAWRIDRHTVECLARQDLGAPPLIPEQQHIPSAAKLMTVTANVSRIDNPSHSDGFKIGYVDHDELISLGVEGYEDGKPSNVTLFKMSLAKYAGAVSDIIDDIMGDAISSDDNFGDTMANARKVSITFLFGNDSACFREYCGVHSNSRRASLVNA